MSNFVELPIEQYSTTAFNNFDPAAVNFKIPNARALMWFSQLAYEGAKGAVDQTVAPQTTLPVLGGQESSAG